MGRRPPLATRSLRRAAALVRLRLAALCTHAGVWIRRRRLAPLHGVRPLYRAANWLGCAALRLIADAGRLGPQSRAHLRRWLAGCVLLWGSDLALGCSRAPAHGAAAVLALSAFAAAAALAVAGAALAARRRPPGFTTPALALWALTLVSLVLLVGSPVFVLALGAANFSIAWKLLWTSIARDRRPGA